MPAEDNGKRRFEEQRREPVPGLLRLPRHLYDQLGPRGQRLAKVGLVLTATAAIVAAILVIPAINDTKDEQREQTAAEEATQREERIRALRRQQRVVRGNAGGEPTDAPGEERLAARRELLRALAVSVERDAQARVRYGELVGEVSEVTCEAYPRTADRARPEVDLTKRVARYSCLAVTSEIEESGHTTGGAIGHPFRARVDFHSGRYAWCSVVPLPGEGAYERRLVAVPPECGG